MATLHTHSAARLMMAPSVIFLFIWMIVPLVTTIYFSLLNYNLLMPGEHEFVGFMNYHFFLTDPAFFDALVNTLLIVLGVLLITVVGGIAFALLLDQDIFGQGIVRILVIAPFFVMPTVAALVWKNMFMNPVNGLFASLFKMLGLEPIDWLASVPLTSIIIIVAWQWLPFATLIMLTALQSLDEEQKEASEMDGAGPISKFIYIILPHMARAITVVILIETIFLLSVFAEILVTTNGGPGTQSTNLTFLVYAQGLEKLDHTHPMYIGSKTSVGNTHFGDGGSGYVVSNRAMRDFFENENNVANRWDEATKRHCCGDLMFGKALKEATGINVNDTVRFFSCLVKSDLHSLSFSPKASWV